MGGMEFPYYSFSSPAGFVLSMPRSLPFSFLPVW